MVFVGEISTKIWLCETGPNVAHNYPPPREAVYVLPCVEAYWALLVRHFITSGQEFRRPEPCSALRSTVVSRPCHSHRGRRLAAPAGMYWILMILL